MYGEDVDLTSRTPPFAKPPVLLTSTEFLRNSVLAFTLRPCRAFLLPEHFLGYGD